MLILLVEDEQRIADFIVRGLRAEGWSVSHAPDGEKACDLLKLESFDAVILDLMLPGMSGMDVCSFMREQSHDTPVLMLSALNQSATKVSGLRAGADDYLTKPFDFDELIARIEALVRRAGNPQDNGLSRVLQHRAICFDTQTLQVTSAGNEVLLTAIERRLLALFLSHPGRIFSRERILNSVWGTNEDPLTNIVDVYVGRLRKKLGTQGKSLETVRGEGYRLVSSGE